MRNKSCKVKYNYLVKGELNKMSKILIVAKPHKILLLNNNLDKLYVYILLYFYYEFNKR